MAVYKIFPEKDATLYSEYPAMNSGIDEIIEATTGQNLAGDLTVSRFLVKFSQSEINDIFENKISGPYSTSLRILIAKVEGLGQEIEIECYPVSGSWENGTGKYLDSPQTINGVSWAYRSASGSNAWATTFPSGQATGSWTGSNIGGGNWYTNQSYAQSSSYQYRSDFDINIDVTNTVTAWYSQSIYNDGFIIKQSESDEFIVDESKRVEFKYFSVDTNTIYPPQLEFKWDDSTFNTGSSTQTIIDTADLVATLPNNSGVYQPSSVQRFRISTRPQFPTRVFTTSSFYTTNYYLPTASFWSIKDLDTNEVVIDFDSTYTKISADIKSSYFDLYMNGLEPERYYQILIKTTLDGNTKILDDKYYFKVING